MEKGIGFVRVVDISYDKPDVDPISAQHRCSNDTNGHGYRQDTSGIPARFVRLCNDT